MAGRQAEADNSNGTQPFLWLMRRWRRWPRITAPDMESSEASSNASHLWGLRREERNLTPSTPVRMDDTPIASCSWVSVWWTLRGQPDVWRCGMSPSSLALRSTAPADRQLPTCYGTQSISFTHPASLSFHSLIDNLAIVLWKLFRGVEGSRPNYFADSSE